MKKDDLQVYDMWGSLRYVLYTFLYTNAVEMPSFDDHPFCKASKQFQSQMWRKGEGKWDILYLEEQLCAQGFSQLVSTVMEVEEFSNV